MIHDATSSEQTTSLKCNAYIGHLNVRWLAMVAALHLFTPSAATPLASSRAAQPPAQQNPPDSSNSMQLQIWVPIVIIIFVLVVIVVALFHRRKIALQITRSRQAISGDASGRTLTAEQLAGSINAGANAATANNRTRRTRRPRRTPSQISTISLPAYAKEPGEQEVVIFRGTDDMEDAGMPEAVVMPALPEDAEESMDSSDPSRYTSLPNTPVNAPLLQRDDDERRQHARDDSRSLDTAESSEEATSVMRGHPDTPASEDPRGETPGYYEVVDLQNPEDPFENPPEPLAALSPAPPASEPTPPRRTSFRRILNSLPNRLSMASQSHIRTSSAFSAGSSESNHSREVSRNRVYHRPTGSGSSSLVNLAPFRTLSRQRSFNNGALNSPSMISLNSISAPLTHTLTRTEFTYPKSGPTPEQLKLISSRESFGRFGVPYGPDAIAFASSSRQELEMPPPGFDEQPVSTGSAGPSRLRSESRAADFEQEADESTLSSVPERESTFSEAGPAAGDFSVPEITSSSADEITASSSRTIPAQSDSGPHEGKGLSPTAQKPAVIPLPESPGAPKSQLPSPKLDILVEMEPLSIPKHLTSSAALPPSSFRTPSMFGRSQSRASSVQTFATAPESMGQSEYQSDLEDDEDFEVETPRLGGGRVLEAGATVTVAPGTAPQ